jgi:hypothetical protein
MLMGSILLLVFCLFLTLNRSPSSSLDSSLLAHCGVLGVSLRFRCWTRDTDSDLVADPCDCVCAEDAAVRTLIEGVRLKRLAGGAEVALAFRVPFEFVVTVGVFLTGTETVRVLILGGLTVNMLVGNTSERMPCLLV